MAVENPVVDIKKFSLDQQSVCFKCTAEERYVCKLAEVQKAYGFKINTHLAAQERVDFSRIPENCPNGYTEPDPQIF